MAVHLQSKSMDLFLYHTNFRHERVQLNDTCTIFFNPIQASFVKLNFGSQESSCYEHLQLYRNIELNTHCFSGNFYLE